MSEHELWNELGNLYFLSGSYDYASPICPGPQWLLLVVIWFLIGALP